jgi:hypothetical protein
MTALAAEVAAKAMADGSRWNCFFFSMAAGQ